MVVLECRVRGAPPLQVRWFRQGSEIQDSPDFRILQKSKAGVRARLSHAPGEPGRAPSLQCDAMRTSVLKVGAWGAHSKAALLAGDPETCGWKLSVLPSEKGHLDICIPR